MIQWSLIQNNEGLLTFQIKATSSCWTETTSTFSNPMSLKEVGKWVKEHPLPEVDSATMFMAVQK
ncbi:MAG: hypothetical protein CR997_12295 [Acidobacteria bacterium]|nr:MAG: hypothetical protein CR997_12295 [Acidobacteriota bacterium]